MSLVTSRIFYRTNALRFISQQWAPQAVCRWSTSALHQNVVLNSRPRKELLVGKVTLQISQISRSIHSSLKFANQNEDGKAKDNEFLSNTTTSGVPPQNSTEPPKQSIIQKFKQMYKQYCGLDVVALLESMGVSEKIIEPLRHSSAGYYALAYAMYKVATPARYAVTIGGTTVSINYLTKWGCIKPVPSKEQLQVMYQMKKASFDKRRDELRKKLRHKKTELRKKMRLAKKRDRKP